MGIDREPQGFREKDPLIEMMRDQMGIVDGDEFSDDDEDEYDWYDGETDSESDS